MSRTREEGTLERDSQETLMRNDGVRARILVLTTSYPSHENDPAGIFIANLLRALRRLGYGITVVAPSSGTFHGRRTLNGIETVRFGYFFPRSWERLTTGGGGIPENMAKNFLARLQLAPMMLMFLVRALGGSRGAHIVYANWLGAGIVGAMVHALTGKPLVVSFRGDDGYLARERRLWRILTQWVGKQAAIVAPVSGELRDIMVELGVPSAKCAVPRFGVDTEMFRPMREPQEMGPDVRLLFVGSLIGRKGLQDLLDALADPGLVTVRLLVVGDGPDGDQLRDQCRRLGLAQRTEWLGPLAPQQVADIMRASDMLCLPSYMEGRPNVVNEAMASGLPVISTRIGGIPDMVREGETALLFDAGNIGQLRECLKTLASDPSLRRGMGRAGREYLVRWGVSWDSTAEEFDDLFRGLLGDRKGKV